MFIDTSFISPEMEGATPPPKKSTPGDGRISELARGELEQFARKYTTELLENSIGSYSCCMLEVASPRKKTIEDVSDRSTEDVSDRSTELDSLSSVLSSPKSTPTSPTSNSECSSHDSQESKPPLFPGVSLPQKISDFMHERRKRAGKVDVFLKPKAPPLMDAFSHYRDALKSLKTSVVDLKIKNCMELPEEVFDFLGAEKEALKALVDHDDFAEQVLLESIDLLMEAQKIVKDFMNSNHLRLDPKEELSFQESLIRQYDLSPKFNEFAAKKEHFEHPQIKDFIDAVVGLKP